MNGRAPPRLFRLILRAYPARLRRERGEEMWVAFDEHLEDARNEARWLGYAWLWLQEFANAAVRAPLARLREARRFAPAKPVSSGDRMHRWLQDLRYAFRQLLQSPGYSLTAVATLTVGIGASAAVFTVVHGVLLRPLDFERPEELVSVWLRDETYEQSPVTPADFADLQTHSTALSEVAGRWSGTTSLIADGEPEQISVAWVSDNYFRTLGIRPAVGRVFAVDEFDAIVISDGLWRRRFGADSAIIGRTVRLGSTSMTVVGVLPAHVNPNVATVGGRRERNDAFRLWPAEEWITDDRITAWIRVVARVAPGSGMAEVETELQSITRATMLAAPERQGTELELYAVGLLDEMVRAARPYLLAFAGGVGFVFLIACFNVANLSLVRSHHRRREFAVRAAIGAGRGVLVRQLLTESAVLAVIGGLGGVGLAHLATSVLLALQPSNLPRLDAVAVDGWALGFAIAASMVAAGIAGVVPAWRATEVDPARMLHERAGTGSRRHHAIANTLIAGEVALSLVLLTGSGLLLRTFVALNEVDPGYEVDRLAAFSVSYSAGGQPEGQAFMREVVAQVAAVPGVRSVGASNRFPFAGGIYGGPFATEGKFAEDGPKPEAAFRWVTAGFFETMGARVLAGRALDESDGPEAAVIDDVLARQAWPDGNAVGQRLWTGTLGRNDWSTVVGVVQQMRHDDLTAEGRGTVFMPSEYRLGNVNWIALRTAGPPEPLMESARTAVRSVNREATVSRARTAAEFLSDATAPARFAMVLGLAFAGIAVLLAAVGVSGVVAFAVRDRTREFGLRMALGATPSGIVRLVVRKGLVVTGAGIALGLVGTAVVTRFIGSMLYGVEPMNPVTLLGGAAVMAASGVVAGLLPARRAATLDPVRTLRAE